MWFGKQFIKRLRAMLNAREPASTDTHSYELRIGPLRMVGDTANIVIDTDYKGILPAHRNPGWLPQH
jgi:hypothetical protein